VTGAQTLELVFNAECSTTLPVWHNGNSRQPETHPKSVPVAGFEPLILGLRSKYSTTAPRWHNGNSSQPETHGKSIVGERIQTLDPRFKSQMFYHFASMAQRQFKPTRNTL